MFLVNDKEISIPDSLNVNDDIKREIALYVIYLFLNDISIVTI